MRRFWHHNSLSIVFLLLFVGALAGQAFAAGRTSTTMR